MVNPAVNLGQQSTGSKRNFWADYLFRPILLTSMITCLSISLLALVKTVNPAWHGAYFLIAMILVTIEAIYSFYVLQSRRSDVVVVRYRLVEWGLIFLCLKGFTYSNKPWTFIWRDLRLIGQTPLDIFSPEFVMICLLSVVAWVSATGTMADFEDLYNPLTFRSAVIGPFHRLRQRFFVGGGILVFISGLILVTTQKGLSGLVNFERANVEGLIINVLLYFMLGLVMLSQAQLTMLLTRWEIQQVPVMHGVVKRWTTYGLTALALITLVVLFLPTRYSLDFLTTAHLTLQFIFDGLFFLFQIMVLILSLPFALLTSLFDIPLLEEGEIAPSPTLTPELPAQEAPTPYPWLEVLRSLAFWLTITLISIYLIRAYFKEHPGLWTWLKSVRFLGLFLNWGTGLWGWLSGLVRAGGALLPQRLVRNSAKGKGVQSTRWVWPRLGLMTPRQQIMHYYLNTLQRSAKIGIVRRKDQTPLEFEPILGETVTDQQDEVHLLTEAFVRARYSQHPFNTEDAALIKTVWRQIRTALRQLKDK